MAPRPPAEQPVQREPVEVQQLRHPDRGRLIVDRLLQPRGRLARRRRQRDQRQPAGLLGQQREDPRDRRRLARARAAGDDREPPPHRAFGRIALALVAGPEQPRQPGGELGLVDRVLAPQRDEVGGHLHLFAPVAVEVEPRADQPQRAGLLVGLPHRDQRARPHPHEPLAAGPATAAPRGPPARRSRRSPSRGSSRDRRTRARPAARARPAPPPARPARRAPRTAPPAARRRARPPRPARRSR